ncbi:enoyl-CoA hydratase [Allokutzneria oryzae]|uniref:Enoyl-CoA hydratase n=1 Tax=Allokutzneria oryzae TaxID=1378989 RepID=A0ABV5ZYK4_9PSEU
MSTAEVVFERRGAVAVVTVSDPERRNALTLDLSQALADTIAACEADAGIGAVVVTGAAPAFCAGADLTQLGASREEGLRRIYQGFLAVANCSLPTVAAVNGAAVGAGLNLALACDLRVAGPKARFDARFLDLGIHPGGGMTWMLQRLVGPQTAKAMVLFGEILDADAALRNGLVWSTAEEAVAAAVELAGKAASAPRELSVTTKSSMRVTAGLGAHGDAVETELVPQVASMDSPAFAERLAALKSRIHRR